MRGNVYGGANTNLVLCPAKLGLLDASIRLVTRAGCTETKDCGQVDSVYKMASYMSFCSQVHMHRCAKPTPECAVLVE